MGNAAAVVDMVVVVDEQIDYRGLFLVEQYMNRADVEVGYNNVAVAAVGNGAAGDSSHEHLSVVEDTAVK